MFERRDKKAEERRKYLRLTSVFPVLFRLENPTNKSFISDWLQGFTNNVGKGGICLAVNNLNQEFVKLLKDKEAVLSLQIEMPITKKPVHASARVAWMKEFFQDFHKCLIGLNYTEINPIANRRMMRYAWVKKLFVPTASMIIGVLAIAITLNSYISLKLIKGNKALVEQLVNIIQESSVAKQKIKEISKEREDLQVKIKTLQLRIQTVEDEKQNAVRQEKTIEAERAKKIDELSSLVEQLRNERSQLQDELIALQYKENNITEELLRLDKRKSSLEKANLDKMYQWIKVHQNPRTGLIMSFEGDKDVANWAFIYDQALVIQAFTNFSDFERANKALAYFAKQAKRENGQFFNAYYCDDGQPAEYIIHTGPNVWLGIAILHYTKEAKDSSYLKLAEEIAGALIRLQNKDSDGGLRGGPGLSWYSTEHNLDAYAFFSMLYKITGKQVYVEARDKVLKWLIAHTYDKDAIPVKRGKGDSTIATDTYAWSIAAIGPEKLEEIGMSPDRIVEFAEKNCSVTVCYLRPEGNTVNVKGFDFAPQHHLARGGIVSAEWTAQMAISFKIMSNFYYKKGMIAKARTYALKADEYLSGLANMVISSPSPSGQGESCLPYATQEYADTGHGWMTPKGKSTGSVSATVYTLFAYYNYNPLTLED